MALTAEATIRHQKDLTQLLIGGTGAEEGPEQIILIFHLQHK